MRTFHDFKRPLLSAIGALAVGLFPAMSMAETKVIGYIPTGKGIPSVIDRTDLSKLTHINLAFANLNAAGQVINGGNPTCMSGSASDINYGVQKAHAAGVKVLISIAGGSGGSGCPGSWRELLKPATRQTVVNSLITFVNTFNLDGVDVDIEGELLTGIDNDGNYTPFIQALASALNPVGKLVTSATATYNGGMVPTSSLPYFNFVNIMSYDAVGPWTANPGGEQATYDFAVSNINTWLARGLTKDKLVLGMPVYGYGFNGYNESYTFADIVAQFGPAAAQKDLIGTACVGCGYITYNGLPTIRSKTTLALQKGSGVMLWELAQDASGANSILGAISGVVGPLRGSSSSASSVKSSVKSSAPSSVKSSVASSIKSSAPSSSVKSSSSSSVSGGQQCNWWGTYYAICTKVTSGWGWENNKDCVSAATCATLPAPYGIVGGTTSSVSSSVKSSSSSSTAAFSKQIEGESYSNMSGVQLEGTTDVGGGQNVGWIDAGDWLVYSNVTIPATGTYRIDYRVASVGGASLASNLNTNVVQFPAVSIPATGGWQNWTTVSQTVQINAGTYNFGIYAPQTGWNLNWFKITKI